MARLSVNGGGEAERKKRQSRVDHVQLKLEEGSTDGRARRGSQAQDSGDKGCSNGTSTYCVLCIRTEYEQTTSRVAETRPGEWNGNLERMPKIVARTWPLREWLVSALHTNWAPVLMPLKKGGECFLAESQTGFQTQGPCRLLRRMRLATQGFAELRCGFRSGVACSAGLARRARHRFIPRAGRVRSRSGTGDRGRELSMVTRKHDSSICILYTPCSTNM